MKIIQYKGGQTDMRATCNTLCTLDPLEAGKKIL